MRAAKYERGSRQPGSATRVVAAGLWLAALLGLMLSVTAAALDLQEAQVQVLDNGLTLVVLEDHTFPVVSVQMLYKVGARNEQTGRTGLAHFLEHMAFRATPQFPDTEVVSAIYAVGGEWHGYTWTDQTTYFETVPREHLDLVLRIEAERMNSLLIPESDVEAERGAVLSELHGYENDPGTILLDTVVATSFLQHPYRHNTIGWESDLESIEHQDLVDFYRRHYRPSNAVLAIVGDVSSSEVQDRVREHFGAFDHQPATPPLRAVEAEQQGERRVEIRGQGGERLFAVAYRAPSVRSPDWPVFLVLQEVLGGGDGVNFLQNEWGVPVRAESRLHGVVDDLSTWYPPSFDSYLMVLSGSASAELSHIEVERGIEERIDSVRRTPITPVELAAARARVLESLVFDIETTEDAAHQLASYLAYEALPQLLELPESISAVSTSEIQRVARTYLQPWQRTIGWYVPVERSGAGSNAAEPVEPVANPGQGGVETVAARPAHTRQTVVESIQAPAVEYLASGLPVLFQHVPFSDTGFLRVLVPSTTWDYPAEASRDWPVWHHTSIHSRFLSSDLAVAAEKVRQALENGERRPRPEPGSIEDPAERLEVAFEELLDSPNLSTEQRPRVIALVGDLDRERSLAVLERHFGDLEPAGPISVGSGSLAAQEVVIEMPIARAQAQLGYLVPAPPPASADALAWRVILYILTHGYEGRLGKEAISRRGLLYYIDSRYRSDGQASLVTLSMGVDPPKLEPLRQLLVESLRDLEKQPPTAEEVDEAKEHLIGRWRSAAQSNDEISAMLLREWVEQGRLRTDSEFAAAVRRVTREDVLRVLPEFAAGATVRLENPQ